MFQCFLALICCIVVFEFSELDQIPFNFAGTGKHLLGKTANSFFNHAIFQCIIPTPFICGCVIWYNYNYFNIVVNYHYFDAQQHNQSTKYGCFIILTTDHHKQFQFQYFQYKQFQFQYLYYKIMIRVLCTLYCYSSSTSFNQVAVQIQQMSKLK